MNNAVRSNYFRIFLFDKYKKARLHPEHSRCPICANTSNFVPIRFFCCKKSSTRFSTSLAFVIVSNGWQKRKSSSIVLLWIDWKNRPTINWEKFAESTDSSSCITNTGEALIHLMSWDLIWQAISAIRNVTVLLDKETFFTFDFTPSLLLILLPHPTKYQRTLQDRALSASQQCYVVFWS